MRVRKSFLPSVKVKRSFGFPVCNYRIIAEEIPEENADKLFEGAKKQIIVNAYERNSKARVKCIEYYKKLNNGKTVCQIYGFDFGAFYGEEMEGKIHVHHLKLSTASLTARKGVIFFRGGSVV